MEVIKFFYIYCICWMYIIEEFMFGFCGIPEMSVVATLIESLTEP